MSFEERIEKTAKILKLTPKIITVFLADHGVDSIEMLDASTTSHNDLQGIFLNTTDKDGKAIAMLKVKAASAILKGEDPFAKQKDIGLASTSPANEVSSIAELIKNQRPVTQWSDEEVLTKYIETDDEVYESELQRRAKNRRFIILKKGTQEEVDVEASLAMLKRARKEEIPPFVIGIDNEKPGGGGKFHIYKVEEYHVSNRIRYESPLRPGVMLFDGFCQVTNQNFKNVGDPARKMLRLIYNDIGQQSRMDETKLVEIAEKEGLDGLGRIYPEIHENYMKLAMTDSLPSLKTIAPVETRQADPFYQKSGNRTF